MNRFGIGLDICGPHAEAGILDYVPPPGNVIANWRGTGTSGTGGLPDGWFGVAPTGVTLAVLSRTPYRGGTIVEFRFSGTAAASGNCAVFSGPYVGYPAAPGQVWRARLWAESVGAQTPSSMNVTGEWHNSSNVFIGGIGNTTIGSASITGAPLAPADAAAIASTAFVAAPAFILFVTSGQTVNLRYKVFAPTLTQV